MNCSKASSSNVSQLARATPRTFPASARSSPIWASSPRLLRPALQRQTPTSSSLPMYALSPCPLLPAPSSTPRTQSSILPPSSIPAILCTRLLLRMSPAAYPLLRHHHHLRLTHPASLQTTALRHPLVLVPLLVLRLLAMSRLPSSSLPSLLRLLPLDLVASPRPSQARLSRLSLAAAVPRQFLPSSLVLLQH